VSRILHEIQIFLASPQDVSHDRAKAIEIIDEVDRTIASNKGLHLKAITWQDVAPSLGRPEQVILDQISMNEIHIFVGIMWKSFGSPTGKNFESGTEEEFYVAYDEWKRKQAPRVMFYFNVISNTLPSSLEMEQYQKVLNFKNAISEKGLYKEYKGIDEFSNLFRQDLIRVISNLAGTEKSTVVPEISLPRKAEYKYYAVWRDAFSDRREPGERVESFLYRSAKRNVKFMTISGRSIFSGDVEEALQSSNDNFSLQILLYDWRATDFEVKMRDERRTTEPEIERARRKAKEIAREFCDLGQQHTLNLQVRLYKDYPIWRMLIVDNKIAYVGYYPPNKRGYEGPMFVFRKDDKESLFYPMNQYFDWVWNKSDESLTVDDPRLK
jgi:hypothetical protein